MKSELKLTTAACALVLALSAGHGALAQEVDPVDKGMDPVDVSESQEAIDPVDAGADPVDVSEDGNAKVYIIQPEETGGGEIDPVDRGADPVDVSDTEEPVDPVDEPVVVQPDVEVERELGAVVVPELDPHLLSVSLQFLRDSEVVGENGEEIGEVVEIVRGRGAGMGAGAGIGEGGAGIGEEEELGAGLGEGVAEVGEGIGEGVGAGAEEGLGVVEGIGAEEEGFGEGVAEAGEGLGEEEELGAGLGEEGLAEAGAGIGAGAGGGPIERLHAVISVDNGWFEEGREVVVPLDRFVIVEDGKLMLPAVTEETITEFQEYEEAEYAAIGDEYGTVGEAYGAFGAGVGEGEGIYGEEGVAEE